MTNLKLVLRTYSALRQMSPDDIALLETLRALNDGDRELMVETLQGKAAARKAGKKSSTSKSSQSSTKSPRASGMAAQLNKSLKQQQREPMTTKDDDYDPEAERCTFIRGDGKLCYLLSDHNVHHMKTHPEYHPFQLSTTAPPAPAPSSANGGVEPIIRNSVDGTDGAGTVAHGASGGD